MLKIVHAADIHAGRPLSLELDKERGYIRRREVETSLWRIVEFAEEEKAGILLIAGDLFEHRYTRPSWVKDVSMLFTTIPETHIFISPGNHDPLLPDSLYRSVEWPKNVAVFSSTRPTGVSLDELGVDVYGIGWTSHTERSRLLEGFRVERPDRLNIVLAHGDLYENSAYLPMTQSDIVRSGADYFALGHIHTPVFRDIGQSKVVYPGCPEPLDFGDEGKRGISLVTWPGTKSPGTSGVSAEFVPMASREVRKAEVDVTGIDTGEKIRNAILAVGSPEMRKRDMLKVILTGRIDLDLALDLDMLEHEFRDDFFCLRLVSEFIPDYDLKPLMDPSNQSLEARFVRKQLELERKAREDEDARAARVANLAMYYGLDALRQGEVLTGRRMA